MKLLTLSPAVFLPALFGTTTTANADAQSGPWISLSEDLQFQAGTAKNPANAERLAAAQNRLLSHKDPESIQTSPFRDSYETYYTGYAQAWRLMGFYADCSGIEEGQQNNNRELDENVGCTRMALWAAYADMGYGGGGLYEYQMFDPNAGEWDDSACQTDDNSGNRCVKMDCHLEGTAFELLGVFKEADSSEWFAQLFKHEGSCIWTENEYDFMSENVDNIPEGCSQSLLSGLYYGTKPIEGGGLGIGAFTDALCTQESTEEVDVYQLTGGSYTQDYIDTWNAGLSIYTLCQPCVAYTPAWKSKYQRRHLEDNNNNNNDNFRCDDAAGYTNVNQCMKFFSQTEVVPVTEFDIMQASAQGGLTHVPDGIGLTKQEAERARQAQALSAKPPRLFYVSMTYLCLCTLMVYYARRVCRSKQGTMNERLVNKDIA
jgi:hypothetical protein